jgi:hypothetical protein
MVPAAPPATSTRSELVRLLAPLRRAGAPEPTAPIAERLGEWMGWAQAITLSSALSPALSSAPASAAPAAAPAGALAARLAAERDATVGPLHAAWARPDAVDVDPAGATDSAPYRLHHRSAQRTMASAVDRLRARVRPAVAAVSPRLRQLAALDAALGEALAARQEELMGRLPGLLEAHWRGRRDAPGWHAGYAAALHALLRAELDLRLQPVDGLIEALREETAR